MHAQLPKRVYQGLLGTLKDTHFITVNGQPLNPRHDLYPGGGMAWGYGGGGPHQLAIALLADAFDDHVANHWAQLIVTEIIEKLDQKKGWVLTEYDLWFVIYFGSPEGEAAMVPFLLG